MALQLPTPIASLASSPQQFSTALSRPTYQFQQGVRVELIVNLKTARTLGLTIPQPILSRANEVIQ
jgi:hypothetical protein